MIRTMPRDWLDHRLLERGLTARELARLAGLNEQTIGAARRGRTIAPRTLRLICQALQVAPVLDPFARQSQGDAEAQSRRAIQASTKEAAE